MCQNCQGPRPSDRGPHPNDRGLNPKAVRRLSEDLLMETCQKWSLVDVFFLSAICRRHIDSQKIWMRIQHTLSHFQSKLTWQEHPMPRLGCWILWQCPETSGMGFILAATPSASKAHTPTTEVLSWNLGLCTIHGAQPDWRNICCIPAMAKKISSVLDWHVSSIWLRCLESHVGNILVRHVMVLFSWSSYQPIAR